MDRRPGRINRRQRRILKRNRYERMRTRDRQGLPPGLDGVETVTFWMPMRPEDAADFQRLLAASLPDVEVDVRFPGQDKQEPPPVAADEGSTTTACVSQDDDGRSTQCAR